MYERRGPRCPVAACVIIVATVIDWGLAAIAGVVAGEADARSPSGLDGALPAAESERLVTAYTGLRPPGALPRPEALDRRGWIDANVRSLRPLLDPLGDRLGAELGPLAAPVRAVGGRARRGRGRGAVRLPVAPRARPVRARAARLRGAGAAAVRGAEPRRGRVQPRRRPRRAAALGRAARDDARAAVRGRAVAARAPRRASCASCCAPPRSRSTPAAAAAARRGADLRASGRRGARGRPRSRS